MDAYFGGDGNYDPKFFSKLQKCMTKFDDDLVEKSQNAAWKGIGDYFKSNGTEKDYMGLEDNWGGCHPDKKD
jgi:hypothetical protein